MCLGCGSSRPASGSVPRDSRKSGGGAHLAKHAGRAGAPCLFLGAEIDSGGSIGIWKVPFAQMIAGRGDALGDSRRTTGEDYAAIAEPGSRQQ